MPKPDKTISAVMRNDLWKFIVRRLGPNVVIRTRVFVRFSFAKNRTRAKIIRSLALLSDHLLFANEILREHSTAHRQHAARPDQQHYQTAQYKGAGLCEDGEPQSGLLGKGPDRRFDGRRRGTRGRFEARRHLDRSY